MIDIFIPSYHRPDNLHTIAYLKKMQYDMSHVYVFIDDEADDKEQYKATADRNGFHLVVFDMTEARKRYDYVHRASVSRRSAGQARNMFQDYAKKIGIDQYLVMDDDTLMFQFRIKGISPWMAHPEVVKKTFEMVAQFVRKHQIGLFGLPQSGDFYGQIKTNIYMRKVMNCTFYLLPYIYRGERGVQDDETSMFVGVLNAGLFTGSLADGEALYQQRSAKAKGGLADLYNECKLYNKAMVVPIQYPSCCWAERQKMNGGRIHHHIDYRYLAPKLMKGERGNIAWDTYPEDWPFTNEPERAKSNGSND